VRMGFYGDRLAIPSHRLLMIGVGTSLGAAGCIMFLSSHQLKGSPKREPRRLFMCGLSRETERNMIHPDALEAGPYPDGKPWWTAILVASLPIRLQNATTFRLMSIEGVQDLSLI
jgi:hypothetical protein